MMLKNGDEIDKKGERVLRRRGSGRLIKRIASVSLYIDLSTRRVNYSKSKC